MMLRPTCLLLTALLPMSIASAALAADDHTSSKAWGDTFIPFGESAKRDHPPLTPTMIPGGIDEAHARNLNATGAVPSPLLAQQSPYRAVDAYRQYVAYQNAGAPATLAGWSAQDWQEYGQKFEGSVLSEDGFDPAQRVRVRQFYATGPVRFINEQGRVLFEGYNAFISDRAVLRTGAFLFTLEPELRLHNTTRTAYDASFDARTGIPAGYGQSMDRNGLQLMEATAQVDIYGAHLTVGRQPLVWGPGYHQQLLLSANAAPMWMGHLTSSEPMALPGSAAKLGYFSPELFVARMGYDRPTPHLLMTGIRLGWQASDALKLGINLTTTLGGKGHGINAGDMLFAFTSEKDSFSNTTQDQKCTADISFLSPWKNVPFEAYAEVGWETRGRWSEAVKLKKGWVQPACIVGTHLPNLDKDGMLSATLEYGYSDAAWYTTNRPAPAGDSAYLYKGVPIGAPMGGDADSYFAELRAKLSAGTEAFVSTNFERHGVTSAPVTEALWETKVGADVSLGRSLNMMHGWHGEASIAWNSWKNFQGARGNSEEGVAVGFGIRRGF